MSREEAASLIKVSVKTLQRAEAGDFTPKGDLLLRAAAVYGRSLAELDGFVRLEAKTVPRGTSPAKTVDAFGFRPEINQFFREFEREVIRGGATDREADFVGAVLRSQEVNRMINVADDGSENSLAQMLMEAKYIGEALSEWAKHRALMRPISSIEPIRPKDVPGAMKKRQEELADELAKGGDRKKKTRGAS